MAEFKSIPIKQIVIPERLRAVEEEHALVISQSIVEHGLLNPITVRATPNAKGGNYTLVAGAHRLRAMQLLDEAEIDTTIVEADKHEAQLIEITENIFRNELSVLDRAVFVQTYRDVWEQRYGKINPKGGRPGNRSNIALLIEEEAKSGFAQHVADRMGLSKTAVKYLNKIAQSLHSEIRQAVRGTPIADNQQTLLKLAKLEPSKQRQAAIALRDEPDVKRAFSLISDAPAVAVADPQVALLSKLIDAWRRASPATRQEFREHIDAPVAEGELS